MAVQRSFYVLAAVAALACGSDPKPPPAAPPQPPVDTLPAPPPPPIAEKPGDDGSTGDVNVSEEIRTACGISAAEARFTYDSARVQQGDQPVLNKLVQCFTTGKLSGRTMRLVGHADPRGEAEYNMVLGGKRADNVKNYLTAQGLGAGQAQTTSRGELEASGTDEASWARDRRVDVILEQ